jgi:hypothetical protein
MFVVFPETGPAVAEPTPDRDSFGLVVRSSEGYFRSGVIKLNQS